MEATTTKESEMTDQPYQCSLCDKEHRVVSRNRQSNRTTTYAMHRDFAVQPAQLETITVSAPTRQAVPAAVMAQVHAKVVVVEATIAYMNRSGWGWSWDVTYRRIDR